jgi:hypothetical protein
VIDTVALRRPSLVLPATIATVAFAMLLPFLVHLVPPSGGVPLGARLLPIFLAPFLAAVLFHPSVALLASLVTPTLNRLVTGQPAPAMSVWLTVELLVFSGLVLAARERWPRAWFLAPVAYVVAKAVALLALRAAGMTVPGPTDVAGFLTGLANAWPGLLLLLALNAWLVFGRRAAGSAP